MTSKLNFIIEQSYRAYYGKLYASLLNQFGSTYLNQIEDSIQNAFYKSVKTWKLGAIPDNKENWLFIVARNNLINQIKKDKNQYLFSEINDEEKIEDLRLQTILFLSSFKSISTQSKILFTLKNVFGLSINEISNGTLISKDAIYKNIKRAKRKLQGKANRNSLDRIFTLITKDEVKIVEEILYVVFNVGFDSFDEKANAIVNEDLCLEALSLTKVLFKKFNYITTQNLLALFCFHIARIPAKVGKEGFVAFFDQNKNKWNQELMSLGFHYLKNPKNLINITLNQSLLVNI